MYLIIQHRFAVAVGRGQMLHGPLLAFAKREGDELFNYDDGQDEYTMPRRHGVQMTCYPFYLHAEVALATCEKFLKSLNAWTTVDESVANKAMPAFSHDSKSNNLIQRNIAARGAQTAHTLPLCTVLCASTPYLLRC